MVHSIIGWTQGVQIKLWNPLRTRAIRERLRGVFMTRCYTNPLLPCLTLQYQQQWSLLQVWCVPVSLPANYNCHSNAAADDDVYHSQWNNFGHDWSLETEVHVTAVRRFWHIHMWSQKWSWYCCWENHSFTLVLFRVLLGWYTVDMKLTFCCSCRWPLSVIKTTLAEVSKIFCYQYTVLRWKFQNIYVKTKRIPHV